MTGRMPALLNVSKTAFAGRVPRYAGLPCGSLGTRKINQRELQRRGKMSSLSRPVAFWVIVAFLIYDLAFFIIGQSTTLFAYDFAVRIGLQESAELVGEYGVRVNRSFGLADTVVSIPLAILSLLGLFLRRQWALTILAAFMGVTLYWPICCAGLLLFLPGAPGYNFAPSIGYWLIFAFHVGFALWTLFLIISRGESLMSR